MVRPARAKLSGGGSAQRRVAQRRIDMSANCSAATIASSRAASSPTAFACAIADELLLLLQRHLPGPRNSTDCGSILRDYAGPTAVGWQHTTTPRRDQGADAWKGLRRFHGAAVLRPRRRNEPPDPERLELPTGSSWPRVRQGHKRGLCWVREEDQRRPPRRDCPHGGIRDT